MPLSDNTLQQTQLASAADYVTALDNLCKLASHSLVFFEKNYLDIGFNSSLRFEILHNYLLQNPTHQLKLLAHDTRPLSQYCPRLLILLQQFSHNMFIYQTPKHLQHITEPFAIADDTHYVRRFHFDHSSGIYAQHDAKYAHFLKSRFMEMWQDSRPSAFTSNVCL
jgi:hypothetical protein